MIHHSQPDACLYHRDTNIWRRMRGEHMKQTDSSDIHCYPRRLGN